MASRGRGAGAPAMRGGATESKPRRTVAASDVRAVYQRRLEELVTRATDAFRVRTTS
jgi:DNA replication initiation complex subunit (GINS family)